MTFLEFLQEESKSQEAIDYVQKQRDKSKRVKLKHTDKKQSEAGKWYVHHNRIPDMLKRQSGL